MCCFSLQQQQQIFCMKPQRSCLSQSRALNLMQELLNVKVELPGMVSLLLWFTHLIGLLTNAAYFHYWLYDFFDHFFQHPDNISPSLTAHLWWFLGNLLSLSPTEFSFQSYTEILVWHLFSWFKQVKPWKTLDRRDIKSSRPMPISFSQHFLKNT